MVEDTNDAFRSRSSEFMTYFQQSWNNHNPKIQLVDLRGHGAGRGVIAVENIAAWEELFALHAADVLNVDNSALRALIPNELEELEDWLALVLVIIYERALGDSSLWGPYLSILPDKLDTLAYWTPRELEELQGSAVLHKIRIEDAEGLFTSRLLPIVEAHSSIFSTTARVDQRSKTAESVDWLSQFHLAATIIMAYAFDIDKEQLDYLSEDGTSVALIVSKGMVPLADLLNADGDKNNAHLVQHSNTLQMISLKPIKAGEEIYNDYGQLPRSDLLRRYGYITDAYSQWDVVEIDSSLIIERATNYHPLSIGEKQQRSQLAEIWEVGDDAFDITREVKDSFDPALVAFIDTLTMDSSMLEEELEAAEAPGEPRLTLSILEILQQILLARRRDYITTIAEDVALLKGPTLPKRLRMAVQVRLGEKEIIATALESLKDRLVGFKEETSANLPNNGGLETSRESTNSNKRRRMEDT